MYHTQPVRLGNFFNERNCETSLTALLELYVSGGCSLFLDDKLTRQQHGLFSRKKLAKQTLEISTEKSAKERKIHNFHTFSNVLNIA